MLPFEIQTQTWKFLSVKTVGSGVTQHLVVTLMSPGAPNAMKLILPNITEKRHGVAPKIKNSTMQLPKSVSHVLTSSST